MSTGIQRPELDFATDVGAQRLAQVYAEALLNAAEAKGESDLVFEEMRTLLREVFVQDPAMAKFFTSAVASRDRKAEAIKNVFEGRSSETLANFFQVLNRRDRLDLARDVAFEYHKLREERARRVRVRVTSAVPLDEDQKTRIADQVRSVLNLEPVLEVAVDPELLGGLVVRVADWLLDSSVRNRIDLIRDQIIESSSHEIQSRRDRFSNPVGN